MANPWDKDPIIQKTSPAKAGGMPWDNDQIVQSGNTDTGMARLIKGESAPEKSSALGDIAKSAGSGIAQGAADLIGLPGTIGDAFNNGLSAITGLQAPPPSQFSGQSLRDTASGLTGGATDYKPQTTAGEYAHTAAEFVPGAVVLGGSGGIVGNALKMGVVPGLASEAAGQAAQKYAPSLEPYARFAGAVGGGMIAPVASSLLPNAQESGLAEIAKAATADGLTPQMMQRRLDELGPNSMIADLGPNFQGQTGALANLPGEANDTIRTALNDRNAGANARLGASLDQLGPRVVPSQLQEGIAQSQQAVGQQYGPVMGNARAVNTEPLANALESANANLRGPAQQAVQRVRGYLDIPGSNVLDPNPSALLQTRQAIDGLLSNEQNPQVVRQLTIARQQVDESLAQSAPGIKDVDAQYAELARQNEAVQQGQRVLDGGRTAPRPDELTQQVQEGALPQGTQIGPSAVPLRLSQGARADIDRIVGNNSNDIVAMNRLIKGEGDWNRQKLATLFGQDRADQLIRVLENEKAYADTRNFAIGNSLSANRLQYQKAYGGGGAGMTIPEYYGAGGILGAIRGAGVKVAEKLVSGLMESRGLSRNAEVANNLIGRDAVVASLLQRQLQGSGLAGPAKTALVNALLDQRHRLEGQSNTMLPSRQ